MEIISPSSSVAKSLNGVYTLKDGSRIREHVFLNGQYDVCLAKHVDNCQTVVRSRATGNAGDNNADNNVDNAGDGSFESRVNDIINFETIFTIGRIFYRKDTEDIFEMIRLFSVYTSKSFDPTAAANNNGSTSATGLLSSSVSRKQLFVLRGRQFVRYGRYSFGCRANHASFAPYSLPPFSDDGDEPVRVNLYRSFSFKMSKNKRPVVNTQDTQRGDIAASSDSCQTTLDITPARINIGDYYAFEDITVADDSDRRSGESEDFVDESNEQASDLLLDQVSSVEDDWISLALPPIVDEYSSRDVYGFLIYNVKTKILEAFGLYR